VTGAGARKTWAGVATGLLVLIGLLLLRGYDPPFLQYLRNAGFDQIQRIWPREWPPLDASGAPNPPPVRIIDIDEASLARLGQWPWSRKQLGKLVDELSTLGAAVVAFDIIFPEPDRLSPSRVAGDPDLLTGLSPEARKEIEATFPDNDEIFAAAINGRPVVLAFTSALGSARKTPPRTAGFAMTGNDATKAPPMMQGVAANIEKLEAVAAGFGSFNIDLAQEQGIARQVPMLATDGTGFYPSLSLEALRVAQGASTIVVNASEVTENAIETIRVGDFEFPVAEDSKFTIRYRRDTRDTYIPAYEVISGEEREKLAPLINGHIVFVGTSAAALQDMRTTSLGQSVPGVLIHAQVVEQILTGTFLIRPQWVGGAELVTFAVLGILLIVIIMFRSPVLGAVAGGAAVAFLAGASAYAFQLKPNGILVDPTFPIFAITMTYLATTAFRLLVADSDRRMLRHAFGHFVSPAVLTEIERNVDSLELGGEVKDITVLFVDIRGFTSLSETLPPDNLVTLINTLLDRWSSAIIATGGTIDKFIGDSIMAFWNAPMPRADHQYYAALAGLGIRQATAVLNAEEGFGTILKERDRWPLKCGVGMCTGPACVGNMGSQTRFDYSAVGETVNVAARTETASKRMNFDIVIAGALDAATEKLAVLHAGYVAMAGRSSNMQVWAVVGDETVAQSAAFADLRVAHAALVDDIAHQRDDRLAENVRKCSDMSEAIEPRLAGFYAAITGRKGDFAPALSR
jgi:adenylate cyclase